MKSLLDKWDESWDNYRISIIKVNGTFSAADETSQKRLESCGLNPEGSFLDYDLLLKHVSSFGFCLETQFEE